ncbi:MAG: HD-GYP domain-containing protein [Lachnospiraceae bacterium]|nr:HD-GYP domain-containing protein [Lachnospiraceae bacterium]
MNLLLMMSGICGITTLFMMLSRTFSGGRKWILVYLEFSSTILMIADRFAYLYRGDASTLGYWMVRVSNFFVFLTMLALLHATNLYLIDLLRGEGGLTEVPLTLRIVEMLVTLGEVMLIVSQYTGWYYTFDEKNNYIRGAAYPVSYVIPVIVIAAQLSVVWRYRTRIPGRMRLVLTLFGIVPLCTSLLQFFCYGLSLTNLSIAVLSVLLFVFSLMELNENLTRATNIEIDFLKQERQTSHRLFEQTAMALVNAIDAKDSYTHGHSARVADYSRRIAEMSGMDEEECEEVYFSALLHDVGKIGIPENIISKVGKLTDEEYEIIKQHPVIGEQILSSIAEYPYLSIAAMHHHERFDGKGYPMHLKGEDIPEIARIVAVADAYDAMTSKRSYREPIPQQIVREEMIKGSGTQFDPKYVKLMQHLIDLDTEYMMKEREEFREFGGGNELHCKRDRDDISEGMLITPATTTVTLRVRPEASAPDRIPAPYLILFDSLDGRVHDEERTIQELNYVEYGTIDFKGNAEAGEARRMESHIEDIPEKRDKNGSSVAYTMEAVRYKDHLRVRIHGGGKKIEVIIALPDSTRYAYIGITGAYCHIFNLNIIKSEEEIGADEIPRIAEEISYIDGPEGDVPSIQVDGYRTEATEGIPIRDGMQLVFHAKNLPTARLVWHCPFVDIFYSENRRVDGEDYREYALIRFDGEYWESHEHASNKMLVGRTDDFAGWDEWKEMYKTGVECTVKFTRKGNTITTSTVNAGILVKITTTLIDGPDDVYVALTGDQVVLTNIRING